MQAGGWSQSKFLPHRRGSFSLLPHQLAQMFSKHLPYQKTFVLLIYICGFRLLTVLKSQGQGRKTFPRIVDKRATQRQTTLFITYKKNIMESKFRYIIIGLITVFIASICCSCATYRNSPYKVISVFTHKNAKIIFGKDTLKSENPTLILATRQKAPLKLSILKDSISRDLIIKSFNSLNYYRNIITNYGIGMLVDKNNPKRYSYPSRLYIDLKENTTDSLTYHLFEKNYRNSFKINILKIGGAINAGLELDYERFMGKSYSTQLLLAYIYSECWICDGGGDGMGIQLGIEQKYFLKAHEEIRFYFSLEGGSVILDTETSIYGVPKFGVQVYPSEQFFFDGSFGVGIQNRYYGTEDSFIDPKMPFNLRIGWRF